MNKKTHLSTTILAIITCLSVFSCYSCSSDDEAPVIESVWRNMTSEPIQQVDYAYPGQTLCLRGKGFSGLQKIIVNDTEIDVMNTLIYDTDGSVTFQLPKDVNVSTDSNRYYIKIQTVGGEAVYQPFYVKMLVEKPAISKFSSTILVPGSRMTITGSNLTGATAVYLPVAFDQQVLCAFDEEHPNTATEINVIVPVGVSVAKGQVEVVMKKKDEITGITYEERAYSATTDFSN